MAPMTMDSLVFISERAQIRRYQRPSLKSHSQLMGQPPKENNVSTLKMVRPTVKGKIFCGEQ
jgi:hypothetical protein